MFRSVSTREKEVPNYEAIYKKCNEYKTLSRAKIAAHLVENHFSPLSIMPNVAAIVAIVALVLMEDSAVVGVPLGAFILVACAPLKWAVITWISTGGIGVALLSIGIGAGIVYHKRQKEPLSENAFKRLMARIEDEKAEDIKRLERKIESYQMMTTIEGYQKLVENYKTLNFKPT